MQVPHLLWFLSTHRLWLVCERGTVGRERPCQVGVGGRDTLGKPGAPDSMQIPAWGSATRRSLEVMTQHPWPEWAPASRLLRSPGLRLEAHLPLIWYPFLPRFRCSALSSEQGDAQKSHTLGLIHKCFPKVSSPPSTRGKCVSRNLSTRQIRPAGGSVSPPTEHRAMASQWEPLGSPPVPTRCPDGRQATRSTEP